MTSSTISLQLTLFMAILPGLFCYKHFFSGLLFIVLTTYALIDDVLNVRWHPRGSTLLVAFRSFFCRFFLNIVHVSDYTRNRSMQPAAYENSSWLMVFQLAARKNTLKADINRLSPTGLKNISMGLVKCYYLALWTKKKLLRNHRISTTQPCGLRKHSNLVECNVGEFQHSGLGGFHWELQQIEY